MHTLISIATAWGSKHGGINSFNTDFLEAFALAYTGKTQVICIVVHASEEDHTEARKRGITLVSLELPNPDDKPNASHIPLAKEKLISLPLTYEKDKTICLGHDLITGALSLGLAPALGVKSALIHHMSYEHYEGFSENAQSAINKKTEQKTLFSESNIVLAIGPLLKGALYDLIGQCKEVSMLVPGLASIEDKAPAQTFTAFMSGRFSKSTQKLKQDYLGIAGVCKAHANAKNKQDTTLLAQRPKLTIYGVALDESSQTKLQKFAHPYAQGQVILNPMPFTEKKEDMFGDLAQSHVALMPSWHEGFGLVAWEAIAACVPLIITKESGVYQLLQEEKLATSLDSGFVHPIFPQGSPKEPFFTEDDLNSTSEKVTKIAKGIEAAKKTARILKVQLSEKYTWSNCAEQAASAFQWALQKGSMPENTTLTSSQQIESAHPITLTQQLTPTQLLSAENEVVPFDTTRQADLDRLITWLEDTQYSISMRLITGEGGIGKTRLALELCKQKRPTAHIWLETDDHNFLELKVKLAQHPTLIVMDYAETRQKQLISLISELKKVPNAQPVRILLIARDAGEWWDDLPSKATGSIQTLLSSYARSGPFKLNPMYDDVEARVQAFEAALQAFSTRLNITQPTIHLSLEQDYFSRPLNLQMAALLSLYGEKRDSANALTQAMLQHEKRYWWQLLQTLATPLTDKDAANVMVIATLMGGFARSEDAFSQWKKITEATHLNKTQFADLFNTLKRLYPAKQEELQALKPDLLGEALVANMLLHDKLPNLLNFLLNGQSTNSARQYCLTVLARLSIHYPELEPTLIAALKENLTHCVKDMVAVAIETPSNLPKIAEQAFKQLQPQDQGKVAGQLSSQIRTESIQLGHFYCSIAEYLFRKSEQNYHKNSAISNKEALSKAVNDYAICLSHIGKYAEAVHYAHKSLEIDTQLAKQKPNKYEHYLAASLGSLANRLSYMGNYEQAFEYAKQALNIYTKLVTHNPDKYEPNLASSLNNLANHLSNMGDYQQAITHAQQSLDIRQKLAKQNPDKYEPDLATSLGNLANHLSNVGDYEQAFEYAKQTLNIYTKLVTHNPDKYEPDLAMSQHNLANHLSDTGNYEQAQQHSQQASETYAQLALRYPDKFTDYLVGSNLNRPMYEWLATSGSTMMDSSLLVAQIKQASAHKQPGFTIELLWLEALNATNDAARTKLFRQILQSWTKLDKTSQLTIQAYYLCTLLYLHQNEPSLLMQQGIDTQQAWLDYFTPRNHRIPAWMKTVMQRLDLVIPS